MGIVFIIFLIVFQVNCQCLVDNCETCSEGSSLVCINCSPGFVRNQYLGCLKIESPLKMLEIIENCKVYFELGCKICQEGYKVYKNRCTPICGESTSCFEPYKHLELRRLQTCSYECLICEHGVCNSCMKGYFPVRSMCHQCPNGCLSCNSVLCYECSAQYYFYGIECIPWPDYCVSSNNPKDCTFIDGYHIECANGFFPTSDKSCSPCSYNCYMCVSSSKCIECFSGYSIGGVCSRPCPDQCSYCDYFGDCESCLAGYVLTNGNCVCPSEGHYLFEGYCYACIGNCSSCNSTEYCNKCSNGYTLTSGKCICPTEGYVLVADKCLSCGYQCSNCNSIYYCNKCNISYTLKNGLCYLSESKSSSISSNILILAIVLPISAVLLGLLLFIYFKKKCIRRNAESRDLEEEEKVVEEERIHSNEIFSGQEFVENENAGIQNFYTNELNPISINSNFEHDNAIYRPISRNLSQAEIIIMNEANFEELVTFVSPDDQGMYAGQSICLLCADKLATEIDVKLLPCGHPFHQKCIFTYIVQGDNKICPICNQKYDG